MDGIFEEHMNEVADTADKKFKADVKEIKESFMQMRERALKAEAKLEAYQLVASYAQDVINYWPNMTFRTVRFMIPKMGGLKEALELLGK